MTNHLIFVFCLVIQNNYIQILLSTYSLHHKILIALVVRRIVQLLVDVLVVVQKF